MKRMQLIAVTLCLIMIATVGAGVVAAKGEQSPQGKVKQFDVRLGIDGEVKGKIIINTQTWKYVVNVRGLSPDTEYWLKCEGVPGVLATATPNANGDLHIQGMLNPAPDQSIAPGATYFLGTGTPPTETGAVVIDGHECSGAILGRTSITIQGTLTDANGNGIVGVDVGIATEDSNGNLYYDSAVYVKTKADGKFCWTGAFEEGRVVNWAVFYGTVVDHNIENARTCWICS